MDEETERWVKAEAARAERERAEYFRKAEEERDARRLAEARRFLATIPPPLPGHARRFTKVFEASPDAHAGEPQTIEGIVFDTHEVQSGHLGGGDNFAVFDVITADGKISSWRDNALGIRKGKAVKIKFVPRAGQPSGYDHCDDTVLELWTEDRAGR